MRFRLLAFVALVLGMVSCQQDFEFVNGVGDEVNFQLSVSAEELATRAGEDGSADDQSAADSAYGAIDYLQGVVANDPMRLDWSEVNLRYTLEVYNYNANGDYSQPVLVKDRQVIIVDEYAPATFDMRLIANRQYHFVVFADFVPQSVTNETQNKSYEAQAELGLHHTIGTTLAEITVKNDDINNEATDAYFVATDITVANTSAYNVILKRPYGKLRVIATDLAELNLNVDPAKVVVSYDAAHPTKFNAITGSIDFEQSVVTKSFTSEYNAFIGKNSLADHFYTAGYDDKSLYYTINDNGVERHTHMTLFTDYILAEEDQDGVHFTMTTYDGDGVVIKEVEFATEIPVQRNYLTTIVGNVLTTATQVEVLINDNFDGEIVLTDIITGTPPNNEIWYTSTNGKVVKPSMANIVSNTYIEDKGIIVFDKDVTSIGYGAFEECQNLVSIVMPETVTNIGYYAFYRCKNLKNVSIPSNVTIIDLDAFNGCSSLSGVIIPNGVTKINNRAFQSCSSLSYVSMPNSVTTIGSEAFFGCHNLTSVTIPECVTSLGAQVFAYCPNIKEFKGKYASDDGRCLISSGNHLIAYANASGEDFIVPNNIVGIGSYAFSGCDRLTNVTIPDSVTTIGEWAFVGCDSLTSVIIPENVTSISDHAFLSCVNLASVRLPDGLKKIGDSAFDNCFKLSDINIPNSVISIGRGAFSDCASLPSINIPDGITDIQVQTFCFCDSLTNVIIPDSVTKIDWMAFSCCEKLSSVTIGSSVTEIGYSVFSVCSSLKDIYCKSTIPPSIFSDTFSSCRNIKTIYVPTESVDLYKTAYYWSSYADKIVGYDF